MGNQNAKDNGNKLLTASEFKVLESTFRAIGGQSDKLAKDKLMHSWSPLLDTFLTECTVNFLYKSGQQRIATITMNQFSEPFYIVERGTIDEQVNFIVRSLGEEHMGKIPVKDVENYVAAVFKSYTHMLTHKACQEYAAWAKHGYLYVERSNQCFAKGIIRVLSTQKDGVTELSKVSQWLSETPLFQQMWSEVFTYLYSKPSGKSLKDSVHQPLHILPMCEGIPTNMHYSPIIDITQVIFVNGHLPHELRYKWRLLFSSKTMGESFSTMIGKITNQGPTLVIVEDEDSYIFGGYATESWSMGPKFLGNETSLLFTLSPAMRCFNASGYNDHFQYLNTHQQTMPNGLGMGGQFNYWGLWLDCEYGLGQSSESCTTYANYVQLSKRKEFKIRNVEWWGVGDLPVNEDDDDEPQQARSVLDSHATDRVYLDLAGKKMHSDGLRDEPLE